MWGFGLNTDGSEAAEVALYLPSDRVVKIVVDALEQIDCRFRFLNTPADVHRCFVDGTAQVAVLYVDGWAGIGGELLDGYRKIQGSGSEPFLVAIGDGRITARRAALAGVGEYLQLPLSIDYVADRMRVAVRTAHWLGEFRRERFRLEGEVTLSSRRLHDTRKEITRLLGRAAEFRDNETGRHVLRVSHSCEAVAREMKLPEHDINLLTQASPLHDIGKIGVPDSILLKPGPLTDAEWRRMKRHTVIGARILAGNADPLIVAARTIALTHHERWDGTGYPRRLKGTNIPVMGRVVAVCDAFDALTSKRPYKDAWTNDTAFAYVAENAGIQFDPEVASAFLRIEDQIADIQAEHSDFGEASRRRRQARSYT